MPTAPAGGPVVDLRRAFAPVASSVWVVTSSLDRSPVGFTAVSVVSVSLDPPLVSFNVGRASSSLPVLQRAGRFAAHLLAADQGDLARRFAADASERFSAAGSWRWDADGLPEVLGAVVRLRGDLLSLTGAGDSLLAVGAVRAADGPEARDGALVHVRRAYHPAPAPTSQGVRP